MRKILVVLVAAGSLFAVGCGEGSNPISGSCVNGETAQCTAAGGAAGVRTCVNGAFTDCSAGGACTPNMTQSCVTACNTVGTQTCNASGVWGNCSGGVEECDGKDNDCNGQTDEGLVRDCETDCGVGKKQCVNAEWTLCSAPSPQIEQCDGKDNDCNGQTDENLSTPAGTLAQAVNSPCTGQMQVCKGAKGWEDPAWTSLTGYEAKEQTCDGIDNDCDGLVDGADPDVGDSCACTTGEPAKVCGTDEGECSKGIQECVPSPGGGNAWTECGGAAFNGPSEELCDGLDNNCNGETDEGNPGGGDLCGEANKDQGGAYESPCTIGQMVCEGGQTMCMGGFVPTPEVCDSVDNDCNGEIDDNIEGDKFESNETCATAKDAGSAIEGQSPLVITASLFNPDAVGSDDVDWYKIKAKEAGGFCNPLSDEEGPFTVTIKLKNIPEGSDYDLCVWNPNGQSPVNSDSGGIESWAEGGAPNVCGQLPGSWDDETPEKTHEEGFGQNGTCEDQGHFELGSEPEEYSFTWTGKCLQNDDQTFYVKVVAWEINPDIDCAPYNIEVEVKK